MWGSRPRLQTDASRCDRRCEHREVQSVDEPVSGEICPTSAVRRADPDREGGSVQGIDRAVAVDVGGARRSSEHQVDHRRRDPRDTVVGGARNHQVAKLAAPTPAISSTPGLRLINARVNASMRSRVEQSGVLRADLQDRTPAQLVDTSAHMSPRIDRRISLSFPSSFGASALEALPQWQPNESTRHGLVAR